MPGMYGADVGELRDAAKAFRDVAQELDSVRLTVSQGIEISAWVGPFSLQWKATWQHHDAAVLRDAATRLHESAAALLANAEEQERASSGTGSLTPGASSKPTGRPSLVPPPGEDPASNKRWWDSLSPSQQRDAIKEHPFEVGAADGIPGWARHEANMTVLACEYERLDKEYRETSAWNPLQIAHRRALVGKLVELEKLYAQVSKPGYQLLSLDATHGRLRAVVSTGDIDTAASIAIHVPGMNSVVRNISGSMGEMDALKHQSDQLMASTGGQSAVVYYLGYEPPQVNYPEAFDAPFDTRALQGSDDLARFALGTKINNPDARLIGSAHSYGTVHLAAAAAKTDVFDALYVSGSPGLPVYLGAIHSREGIYVSKNSGDLVTWAGFVPALTGWRVDPSLFSHTIELDNGARLFVDDAGRPHALAGGDGHGSYFDVGSSALYNEACVLAGRPQDAQHKK